MPRHLSQSLQPLHAPDPHDRRQAVSAPLHRLKAARRSSGGAVSDSMTIARLVAEILAGGAYARPLVRPERDAAGRATGRWRVVEGEDVRRALRVLAFRGHIKKSHPVQCLAIEGDEVSQGAARRSLPIERARAVLQPQRSGASDLSGALVRPSEVLQAALAQDADAAVVAVLHAFVIARFYPEALSRGAGAIEPSAPPETAGRPYGARFVERHAAWSRRLPKASVDLWSFLFGLTPRTRLQLLGHCMSLAPRRTD